MTEWLLDLLSSRELEFACVLCMAWGLAFATAAALPEHALHDDDREGDVR